MFDIESSRLLSVGNVSPDPAWEMPAHTHDYWEFVYFVRGTGRIELPDAAIRPQQFHVVVYPPGLPHAETSDPINPEETIFLGIDVQGSSPQGTHLLISDKTGEMGWLCQRILEESSASGISRLAEAYCRAFLCLVDNAWETRISVQHDTVDFALQYIHSNYDKDISLEELAHAASVSKGHLSHSFSARLGVSPLRYLQQVRIEVAKRLLLTTDLPISEVALLSGFKDPYYFSRVIRKTTNYSPSSFRDENKSTSASIPKSVNRDRKCL
ncbi:MAG TPA: AraC family transcriptional regulator [Armatimonadota bacterium]|nr:AraC family transcriptional regulator [Armatimonadota bacterium]